MTIPHTERLPLPPDVHSRLQVARKEAGKTQDEAAEFLGVARTTVVAIEKGDRRIQPTELVRLLKFYGKQVADFLKQSVPAAPLALQLRSVPSRDTSLESELDRHAWTLQHLCEDYLELERLVGALDVKRYPPNKPISGVSPDHAGEDAASAERNRLGLGDGPVLNIRDTLEQDVGLRIFFIPMSSEIAAMFAFDEVLGGCIAVNQSHPEERRRLSIAHEYAHFLTTRNQPSVELSGRYRRLPEAERFATAFAPAFLMPATGLSRRFNEARARNGKFTFADLLTLAHYFGVSVESLTRRLERLRLIPRGTWERIRESGFKAQEGKAILKLVQSPSPTDLLPTRYLLLALQGYRDAAITESQFAKFMRVDLLEARRFADVMADSVNNDATLRVAEGTIDRPDFLKAVRG